MSEGGGAVTEPKDYERVLVIRLGALGDFVLSGGELPALVVIEAMSRMLPGAALKASHGKLQVGLDIIEKPGRLDADEWEKVRQHPLMGAQMAAQIFQPGVKRFLPVRAHIIQDIAQDFTAM